MLQTNQADARQRNKLHPEHSSFPSGFSAKRMNSHHLKGYIRLRRALCAAPHLCAHRSNPGQAKGLTQRSLCARSGRESRVSPYLMYKALSGKAAGDTL